MPQVLSESGSEEEIPLKPLSENKLSSMESAIIPTTIEQDEQPVKTRRINTLGIKTASNIDKIFAANYNQSINTTSPIHNYGIL